MSMLRDAVRALRAAPMVSAVAILSLALGIGATTAMFSILDALLLRSLPVREPHRLMQVSLGGGQTSITNPIWEQIRDRQAALFDGAVAWGQPRFDLSQGGETELVNGMFTNGGFFEVLGVTPAVGRFYSASDDARGGGPSGPVAVIGHGFWQRRFGGAEDVVGKTLTIQRVTFTIIGVAPAHFTGPEVGRSFDVAVPLGTEPLMRGRDSLLDRRTTWWLSVIVRLRPDQTIDQASTLLAAVRPQIREATLPVDRRPDDLERYLNTEWELVPAAQGPSFLRTRYAKPMQALMGVVSLVLLIACANIANLLLARATARRKELSVRLALGASRFRLARQLFAESLLLSVLGAALGLVVARWGSALLVRQLSTQVNTVYLDVGVDWRMLLFTGLVAVATALIFGTAPAWRAGRVRAGEALTLHARGGSESHQRLAGGLVVVQMALSLVLVVAAGLFLRTFSSLATRDIGMDRGGVLIAGINAQRSAVDPAARVAHFEKLRQELAALPGVESVAASTITPISGSNMTFPVDVPDRPDLGEDDRFIFANEVSPDWFRTYGTALVAGRDFNASDAAGAPGVVIVNQKLAAKFFGTESPLGRRLVASLRPNTDPQPFEIVGVARDAAYRSLREPVPPTVYFPLAQRLGPISAVSFAVRAGGASGTLSREVTATLARVDRDLTITFRALDDQVNAALIQERLLAILSGFFGALALLLAGLGLYGVTAYAVSRRRVEMGIRLALGATPRAVLGLVFSRVGALVAAGVILGGLASYWAAALVTTLTYGVDARDPVTLASAAAVLIVTGTVAAWLPARRASRIDPAEVLREG